MSDVEDLRERLVGQRFYDRENEEAFAVVGITPSPPLALVQYDDGVGWDVAASNFTVSEEVAERARLDEDGLDSERYLPLGAGPRIGQICAPGTHEWHPWPDDIWPGGPPEEVQKQLPGHPHDFYARLTRCKRCGLSGDVASQFGAYGSDSDDTHAFPWFCVECGDAFEASELVFQRNAHFCPTCVEELDTREN